MSRPRRIRLTRGEAAILIRHADRNDALLMQARSLASASGARPAEIERCAAALGSPWRGAIRAGARAQQRSRGEGVDL